MCFLYGTPQLLYYSEAVCNRLYLSNSVTGWEGWGPTLGGVSLLGCRVTVGVLEGSAAKLGVVEAGAEILGVILFLISATFIDSTRLKMWGLTCSMCGVFNIAFAKKAKTSFVRASLEWPRKICCFLLHFAFSQNFPRYNRWTLASESQGELRLMLRVRMVFLTWKGSSASWTSMGSVGSVGSATLLALKSCRWADVGNCWEAVKGVCLHHGLRWEPSHWGPGKSDA